MRVTRTRARVVAVAARPGSTARSRRTDELHVLVAGTGRREVTAEIRVAVASGRFCPV